MTSFFTDNMDRKIGQLAAMVRAETSVRLKWTITWEEGEPWVLVDVAADEPHVLGEEDLPREYAVWRATLEVYRVVAGEVVEPAIEELAARLTSSPPSNERNRADGQFDSRAVHCRARRTT